MSSPPDSPVLSEGAQNDRRGLERGPCLVRVQPTPTFHLRRPECQIKRFLQNFRPAMGQSCFRFFEPTTTEYCWGPLLGKDIPSDIAAFYTDPFYAECRAYGRINETVGRSRKHPISTVAVPCHGFVFLGSQDQRALVARGIDLRPRDDIDHTPIDMDMDYQTSATGGSYARAIVKDVWSSDSGINTANLGKVLSGIVCMNAIGIYNTDIRLDNFCAGRIVSFSLSWTKPHKTMDALGRRSILRHTLADREMFDEMVGKGEIPNPKHIQAVHRMRRRSQRLR
ncbi:hypothetical protein FSARC_12445 [Fusarium sarcochroum]|uniref:Uncharacterized protein n=1 Tax=Fusarium sarcochroum TaxID=1208366 RepID=A0A8H4T8I9_9HYPO|nr:hypothetical protein FSARC_12445 [Fusarium sarcochroum]